jgi:hypothetical protein
MNARSGPSDIILSGNSWVANQRVIIKIASRREFMDAHHRGGRFEKQETNAQPIFNVRHSTMKNMKLHEIRGAKHPTAAPVLILL